jgi:hypothetical protein
MTFSITALRIRVVCIKTISTMGLIRINQLPVLCGQVAAYVSDMFCNYYFMKNYKIANNSTTTTKGREKISTYLESIEFYKIFVYV